MADTLRNLRESSRELALMDLQDKSINELREVMLKDLSLVSGLPSTQSGALEGYKLLGEADACRDLIAHHEEIRKLKTEWKDAAKQRAARAITNMPNAITYEGQLVASILEEENGLAADEIACYTDELAAMDEEAFIKLLAGLAAEGIIEKRSAAEGEESKYFLRMPLLQSGTWTAEYLRRYFDALPKNRKPYQAGKIVAVFALLERSKEPLSANELMQRINSGEPSDIRADFRLPVTSDFDLNLDELEERGFIKAAFRSSGVANYSPIGDGGYSASILFYAPALLGERNE